VFETVEGEGLCFSPSPSLARKRSAVKESSASFCIGEACQARACRKLATGLGRKAGGRLLGFDGVVLFDEGKGSAMSSHLVLKVLVEGCELNIGLFER